MVQHSEQSQEHTLRIAGIEAESIVDGPGFRMTVFTQGCLHNCKGCHNPQTHDLMGGYLTTAEDILEKFLADPLLSGITFSGGEPFLQPEPLLWLARMVHAKGKNVMAYSGYTLEELLDKGREDKAVADLVREADYLVDGPYIEALRDLELEYRGSSNQRWLSREDMAELIKAWEAKQAGI